MTERKECGELAVCGPAVANEVHRITETSALSSALQWLQTQCCLLTGRLSAFHWVIVDPWTPSDQPRRPDDVR